MLRIESRVRTVLLVAAAGLLAAASAVCFAPERLLVNAPKARAFHRKYEGVRLLRNDYDRTIYADRGAFVRDAKRPYRDTFSEYPVLATYLFGLPWLVTGDLATYRALFTFMMAGAMLASAWMLTRLAPAAQVSPWRAAALLLPGTVYGALNFFDAAPALATLAAVGLLISGRPIAAHAALAAGFLLKAYPLIYLPAFLAWTFRQAGLPTALRAGATFAAVVALFAIQLAAWSGPEALLAPFRHQMRREDNAESLYHVMVLLLPMALLPLARVAFLALQALPGLAAAAVPRDPPTLFRWLAAATLAFVLFSRFQSPQWVVWITPLALLAASARGELALVVAQDVAAYLYLPIAYDRFGPASAPFAFVVGALTAVRLLLLLSFVWPHYPDAHARAAADA